LKAKPARARLVQCKVSSTNYPDLAQDISEITVTVAPHEAGRSFTLNAHRFGIMECFSFGAGCSNSTYFVFVISCTRSRISAAPPSLRMSFQPPSLGPVRIKHDVPVFNRSFRDVAHEYLLTQELRPA
jgi:hypothetical protein